MYHERIRITKEKICDISRIRVSSEKLFCFRDKRDVRKVAQEKKKRNGKEGKKRGKKSYDAGRRDVPQRNSAKKLPLLETVLDAMEKPTLRRLVPRKPHLIEDRPTLIRRRRASRR